MTLYNKLCKMVIQNPNSLKNGFMYTINFNGRKSMTIYPNGNVFEIGNKYIFDDYLVIKEYKCNINGKVMPCFSCQRE